MLYADAITHTNQRTLSLLKTNKLDKPSAVQITGNSVEEIKKAILHLKKFDLIDINCGCPSSKLIGSEAGSFLLTKPDKIVEMIKSLKKSGKTITAKIRIGFEKNNVLEIAKKIEKAGADAITVHARLATQKSNTPADWSQISLVKKNIGIPVIGNGDISSPEKVKEMLEITNAAMVARSAIGDPLFFSRSLHYLKKGKETSFNIKENINQFQKYIILAKKYDITNIGRIKLLGSNFLRNYENARKDRFKLMQLKSYPEILSLVKGLKKNL